MELIQILGNTWCLADWQLIPLYRTDERHCVLLDSGLVRQRDAIEDTLAEAGLEPVGIIGTHSHTDHSPNHGYFQQKYGIPVAMSAGEAAIASSPLMLKAYYWMLSLSELEQTSPYPEMLLKPDRIIAPEETQLDFCGARFTILPTPGHSPAHIAVGTPDVVLYLGDAMMSDASLAEAKLPYFFHIGTALETMERLAESEVCGQYRQLVLAHRGIHTATELPSLAAENRAALARTEAGLLRLIDRPMTVDELVAAACEALSLLSSRPLRAVYYDRNLRTYLDHLLEQGALERFADRGLARLRRTELL